MTDAIFALPRLADIYDAADPDRIDLDACVAMVDEFDAQSVLDVGCGTGTLACLLAERGLELVGVDPAVASLGVARRKPDSKQVRWLRGDATALPPLRVDLATMTGNVAHVDIPGVGGVEVWQDLIDSAHRSLCSARPLSSRPTGRG